MHSRFVAVAIAFALLALGNCRGASSIQDEHQVEINLIERLPYAEKIGDTQSIVAGTGSGKTALLSGWSAQETNNSGVFVRPVDTKATFAFHQSNRRPLYLHLKMKGSSLPVEIFLNSNSEGELILKKNQDFYTIPLSEEDLKETNVISFQFPEDVSGKGAAFSMPR